MTHLKGAPENPSSHWRVDLDQPGPSSAAQPMPTDVAAMKSMVEKGTTEVRWRGGGLGYRGVGYRGDRLAYRGGLGHRGLGYGLQPAPSSGARSPAAPITAAATATMLPTATR